jgi:hypothetical protein
MTENTFPNWLKYLLDVCRPNWREVGLKSEHPRAIALLDSFYDEDGERMMAGVKSYLRHKADGYIPFPGELEKHLPAVEQLPAMVPFVTWHKYKVAAIWPICPECGEHTPSLMDCPFCLDMVTV